MSANHSEGRECALLAEDEALAGLDLSQQLEDLGFEVVGPLTRLDEALEAALSARHLAVAVLDINLAGERSWPVARVLRDRNVPFLFVTGYVEALSTAPPDLANAPICAKPIAPHMLAQAVNDLLLRYS